jgi:hypothetical protein
MIACYILDMKKWLKILILVLVIGVLAGFLFQKQIISTVVYAVAMNSIADNQQVYIVPKSYELLDTAQVTYSSIEVDTIRVPLLFEQESFDEGDFGYQAIGEEKSVVVLRNPPNVWEGLAQGLEGAERESMCAAYQAASGVTACDSEYDFLRALFFTTPENTHWYSAANKKIGFSLLVVLKSTYGNPAKEFVSGEKQGFISESENGSIVELFFSDEQYYQILFTGYAEAERDYTIANIEVIE